MTIPADVVRCAGVKVFVAMEMCVEDAMEPATFRRRRSARAASIQLTPASLCSGKGLQDWFS